MLLVQRTIKTNTTHHMPMSTAFAVLNLRQSHCMLRDNLGPARKLGFFQLFSIVITSLQELQFTQDQYLLKANKSSFLTILFTYLCNVWVTFHYKLTKVSKLYRSLRIAIFMSWSIDTQHSVNITQCYPKVPVRKNRASWMAKQLMTVCEIHKNRTGRLWDNTKLNIPPVCIRASEKM